MREFKRKIHPLTSFSDLGLAEPIQKALADEGYTTPTPIQAKSIPPVLEGHDLLGIAQTGTGKTAAFALPILHRLASDRRRPPRKGCRVLVLSPTRELASQIAESFRAYGRHLGVSVAVVFGGVGHRPQIKALSHGVDVLVAAPGRLLDLMDQRAADISGTEVFVLDEADQMLDLGFVKPIRRIVSHLSHRRQNLFFSATMPTEIAGLASDLLRDPIKVAVAPVATTAERVSQRIIHIEAAKKRALLAELLATPDMARTLVFTRTKRGADRVARHLENGGTKVAAIHGNKSQRQRELALDDFKHSRINVLVATDIAARGIDVDLVTHVVNYELPEVPEAYVHRIGRTARAGASGTAISLCDAAERDLLRGIERLTRQRIPSEDRRGDNTIEADRTPPRREDGQPTNGARHGRGPGRGKPRPHRGAERSHAGRERTGDRDAARGGQRANGETRGRPERSARGAEGDRARAGRGERAAPEQRNGHSAGHRSGGNNRHTDRRQDDRSRGRDRDRQNGEPRPANRDDERATADLRKVGFLARASRGGDARPRRQGFNARPNRDAR